MIALGLMLLAAVQDGIVARDPAGATSTTNEAPAHVIPDDDIRRAAAIVGRRTAGQAVGAPGRAVDKLLTLGRNDKGDPAVIGMAVIPTRSEAPRVPPGSFALLRTRARPDAVVPGPHAADFAWVAATGTPLYVVGEWARPAPVWEIVRLDGAVQYRTIGEVGETGPWLDTAPPQP